MNHHYPPEVIKLARLRLDRDHGPGTWDEFVTRAAKDDDSDLKRRVDRICQEVLRRADQDVRDIYQVLKNH